MKPNGPAVKLVSVTWRSHPAITLAALAWMLSRWQDGGACPDEAKRRRGRIFCTRPPAKNVTNNLPLLSVLGVRSC